FIWAITKPVLLYAAELVGDIADDIVAIDQAIRWGFSWEMGPFEMWDALGLKDTVARMQSEGDSIPEWVVKLMEERNESFYKVENNHLSYYENKQFKPLSINKKEIDLKRLKKRNGVIKKNTGASLID